MRSQVPKKDTQPLAGCVLSSPAMALRGKRGASADSQQVIPRLLPPGSRAAAHSPTAGPQPTPRDESDEPTQQKTTPATEPGLFTCCWAGPIGGHPAELPGMHPRPAPTLHLHPSPLHPLARQTARTATLLHSSSNRDDVDSANGHGVQRRCYCTRAAPISRPLNSRNRQPTTPTRPGQVGQGH